MSYGAELSRTIGHLKATLAHADLTDSQQERGRALFERLSSPVRMTLLGMPGSGKTEMINMLVGQRLLPAIPDLPTTELVYGDEPGCRVVFEDGTEVRMGWPEDEGFDWSDAVFVKVAYPLPILNKISLLEIVTDGTAQDLSNALNWAIPRTDMAIWCTQEFDRLENALWVQVPDVMKDHGILVVTKADELGVKGTLAETLKRLNPIIEEEFQSLYAVATTHFLAGIDVEGKVSADVRKLTGAGAILDAVMGDVDRGRQADLDATEVFLARFGVDEVPDTETPDAPDVKEPEEPVAEPTREPAAKNPEPSIDAPSQIDDSILTPALEIVREKNRELSEYAQRDDDISDEVLATCTETVDQLVELFSEKGFSGNQLAEETEEAYEMLVLMQLEQGESSAADAATVILQLTHELEMAQAA